MDDLSKSLSQTTVSKPVKGVSFRGRGLKQDSDWDEVIAEIKSCDHLTYLDLEGNSLGVDAAKSISEVLKNKKELVRALWKDLFTGRLKEEIPKALEFLGTGLTFAGAKLTELDLSDNAFGRIGVEALVTLLKSPVCYKLEILRLNNNGLGITGGELLATALLDCYSNSLAAGEPFSLKVFIAGRNRLENKGITALSKVFETLGSLEEISIPQNGIFHQGISMLCQALQNNPNLRLLNLNDNLLTVKGAFAVSRVLPQLQKLQVLNLGDCLLKNKGAIVIAGALVVGHPDLEEVFFDANEIRPEGSIALIKALKNKPKLKKIHISENAFGKNTKSSLVNEMQNVSKSDVLDCPSDEDNDETDEESESDESAEDEDEDNSEEEDNVTSNDTTAEDSALQNILNDVSKMSVIDDSPIGKFLNCPSAENFTKLQGMDASTILETYKMNQNEINIQGCIELIMKISNLSSNKNETVKNQSRTLAVALYEKLFESAKMADFSTVNNYLFVYLALIKDEDKKIKVSWDVDLCIKVLETAIVEKKVPSFTQHILTCCLERKFKKKNVTDITLT